MNNNLVFAVFSNIMLDVQGSNLENTGWLPSESYKKDMGDEFFERAIKEYHEKNEKVLFTNVKLQWDSCDCGDGYGCSHGNFVWEIHIHCKDKKYEVPFEDADQLLFEGNGKQVLLPTLTNTTVYDFIRACELCEIELDYSDYAKSLLNNYQAEYAKIAEAEFENVPDEGLFPNHSDKDIWMNGFESAIDYMFKS